MRELLGLLNDGNSRTIEQLAAELHTSPEDIGRQLEYLENIGMIRRVSVTEKKSCGGKCGRCNGAECRGCMPQNASANMGNVWEVVR